MIEPLDVEWVAFRAGLKPAIRITCDPREAEAHLARLRRLGAFVERTTWQQAGVDQSVLYVARSAEAARELVTVEAPMLSRGPIAAQEDGALGLGRLLGYPRCCTEAYVARWRDNQKGRRGPRPGCIDRYLSTRAAVVDEPRWELDDLLLEERLRVVTFQPCRYDCPVALRYARAVLDVIARVRPGMVGELRKRLAVTIAIDADGHRAVVERDGARVVAARAPRTLDDRVVMPDDEVFAASLVGSTPPASTVVVAFG